MKIVTVIGARPQFIKAATVARITRRTHGVREILVHTGQHYDANLSDVFFLEMEIPSPAYHLGIGSGTHGAQTGRMLEAIEQVLMKETPDWALVYGDTNSTLAAALAAAKLHIPVAHVEAGLRSFNKIMPEETNRVLTDHLADLLFTPTSAASHNLAREGIAGESVQLVGDVMYDAALYYGGKAERQSRILDKIGMAPRNYVLATIHRAENTDNIHALTNIFHGLAALAKTVKVVMPLHPRTRAALRQANITIFSDRNFVLMDPVGYLDMIMLEKHARLIVTDSGGVQKEAYFFKVPCATLRHETEWVELVESGWNTLIPPQDSATLHERLLSVLHKPDDAAIHEDLYGSGSASDRIVEFMCGRIR